MRFSLLLFATAFAPFVGAAEATPPAPTSTTKAPAPAPVLIPADGLPKVWLQGEPVTAYAPGTLYIFEFWATWCGPCIQAMPHMESLQRTFKDRKDVRIVGINVMDSVPTERLLPFLKSKGVTVTYAMAADGSRQGPAQQHWLKPLGVDAIPFAMAVRDGRLIWRGHPTKLDTALVEAMSKPDYSADKAPATREQRRRAVMKQYDPVSRAIRSRDRDAALLALRTIVDADADEKLTLPFYDQAFRSFEAIGDQAGAYAVVRLMTEQYPESRAARLSAGKLAVGSEIFKEKDTEFALQCADVLLAKKPADVGALELRAAALSAKGDHAGALAAQEQAVRATELRLKIEALRREVGTSL